MSLQTTPTQVLQRRLRARQAELDEYARLSRDAGGFLAHDPRALRMVALGDEIDEIERELDERGFVDAHEDTDDHDQI